VRPPAPPARPPAPQARRPAPESNPKPNLETPPAAAKSANTSAEHVHDLKSTRLARQIVGQFPEGAKVTQRAFLAEFRKHQPISNKDGAALHRYATNAADPDQNGGR